MSASELPWLLLGTLQGVGGVAIFLLVLLIGFCLALDWTKFRRNLGSRVVRNLDERMGQPASYLPPAAPRGPSDQLAGARAPR